jgi:gamma-glutamylcyclotransferase (GGCT)/AIG2-like uncharacterized protein YtfP
MDAPREFLFVYGTLRADLAHPMARAVGKYAELVGPAYFRGKLFDVGEYPGAVASPSPSDRLVGELHRIEPGRGSELLAELDRYEGWNPDQPGESEFMRERAWIESEAGDRVEAWIYTYNRPTAHLARIASVDYRVRDVA